MNFSCFHQGMPDYSNTCPKTFPTIETGVHCSVTILLEVWSQPAAVPVLCIFCLASWWWAQKLSLVLLPFCYTCCEQSASPFALTLKLCKQRQHVSNVDRTNTGLGKSCQYCCCVAFACEHLTSKYEQASLAVCAVNLHLSVCCSLLSWSAPLVLHVLLWQPAGYVFCRLSWKPSCPTLHGT